MLTLAMSEALRWQRLLLSISTSHRGEEFAYKDAVALREGRYKAAFKHSANSGIFKNLEGASCNSKLGMYLAGYAAIVEEFGPELITVNTQILQRYPNAGL